MISASGVCRSDKFSEPVKSRSQKDHGSWHVLFLEGGVSLMNAMQDIILVFISWTEKETDDFYTKILRKRLFHKLSNIFVARYRTHTCVFRNKHFSMNLISYTCLPLSFFKTSACRTDVSFYVLPGTCFVQTNDEKIVFTCYRWHWK